MNYSKKGDNKGYALFLAKGVGLSYVVTFILFIILAIIMTYTSLAEGIIPIANSVIMVISIALGSIYVAIKVSTRGWINGAIVGLFYMLILILFSAIFVETFKFDVYLMTKSIIVLVTGAVGGMIGVNLK